MNEERDIFVEGKENIVGHLILNTGTLLMTDGVWVDNIKVSQEEKLAIDLGTDRLSVPVIGTKQNGRRFLLIPIDAAEQKDVPGSDKVEVTDPVEEEQEEEENND